MRPMPGPTDPARPRRGLQIARLILYSTLAVTVLLSVALRLFYGTADRAFIEPVSDVRSLILNWSVDEPDEDAIREGAIAGMLAALDDPYADYIPPRLEDEFEKQITGEYVGIGAEITVEDDLLTIVTPLDDSPAWRAGVLPGDRVLTIDGDPAEGITVDGAIERLTGEPGSVVTIGVTRAGEPEPIDIAITRQRITAKSVRGFARATDGDQSWRYAIDPDRGIGYARISQFAPSTYRDLVAAIDAFEASLPEGARPAGLIIDVRDNPGGLLQAATEMTDLFLDGGVIVTTRGRRRSEQSFIARPRARLEDAAIAVLINERSASASEVLAGALVDNERAVAVGARSFGKGSVQSIHRLGGGTAERPAGQVKLTEQRYYLPSGRSIQRKEDQDTWGVDPSPGLFVPMSTDEWVDMVRVRREADILGGEPDPDAAVAERWADPDWIRTERADPQLAAALAAVRTKIDTGDWPAPTETDADRAEAERLQELAQLRETRDRIETELARLDGRIAELTGDGQGDDQSEPDSDSQNEAPAP